jgi:hypothetical protein
VVLKNTVEKCWALVAHACNPTYSGRRDEEDHGLKTSQTNSSRASISKIPNTKRAGGMAQGMSSSLAPQKKKKDYYYFGRMIKCSQATLLFHT